MAMDFPNSPTVGQVFTNLDRSWVWDGTAWVGLTGAPVPLAQGINPIINGGFAIWQRSAAWITVGPNAWTYTADQWQVIHNSPAGATVTVERLPPPNNAAGGRNGCRWRSSAYLAGATYNALVHRIEGVDTYAGRTVTLSFSVSSSYAFTGDMKVYLRQSFGSGGSADVTALAQQTFRVTDGEAQKRISYTFTMPSISGKTIGNGHHLILQFDAPVNMGFSVDLAAVKLEPGGVATPYVEPPIADELMRCQRYLRAYGGPAFAIVGTGILYTASNGMIMIPTPGLRATPTLLPTGVWYIADGASAWSIALFAIDANLSNPPENTIGTFTINGTGTPFRPVYMYANNQTGVRIYLSAEL